MEWTIKIEGKEVDLESEKKLPIPNQKILVKFDAKNEELRFIGQYKPHGKEWVDFSEESYSMEIDLETIQELLFKVYKNMQEKIKAYENVSQGFDAIKLIQIPEDEE